MRIIGGKYRSKKLIAPDNDRIRPTTDRMRETIFNIIQHGNGPGIKGSRVLDLFSGSGAFGIEALSREASQVTFVDKSSTSMKLIRKNTALINNPVNTIYLIKNALNMTKAHGFFNLIFIDPPYYKDLITPALLNIHEQNLLCDEGLIITEYSAGEKIDFTSFFKEIKTNKIGEARFSILKECISDDQKGAQYH